MRRFSAVWLVYILASRPVRWARHAAWTIGALGGEVMSARESARDLIQSIFMEDYTVGFRANGRCRIWLLVPMLCAAPYLLLAQASATPATPPPTVPDWSLPGSSTHKQVPPPSDFHRPSKNFNTPIG